MEEELYRVVQEALNNSLKHAAATHLSIRIATNDGLVEINVEDDGVGFDTDLVNQSGGMGLRNIKERMERLGGSFTIISSISSPGEGTKLRVRAPISDPQTTGEPAHP